MRFQFKSGTLSSADGDRAIFLFSDDSSDLKQRPELAEFQRVLTPILKSGQFKPALLAELPVRLESGWLFLIGLGQADQVTPEKTLEAAALAGKAALARQIKNLDVILPQLPSIEAEQVLSLFTSGFVLSTYQQSEFKSKPSQAVSLASVKFWGNDAVKGSAAALAYGEVAARAVCLARRLGDMPPNKLYPETFAAEALALAKKFKIKAEVLDENGLARENMNLVLAVGSGSDRPPRMVTLKYRGGQAGAAPVVLVGKGITFDSGGISLKPSTSMEGMKTDMAGAATVLAVIAAAAELKLPLNINAVLALAENMPDGAAMRVGDVFTSRSGQTVEVTNTDAEGRLVLAEALTWAGEMKPKTIIDVATLTGACVVALGERCAGLFTNDSELRKKLMDVSSDAGEALWPLPLFNEYEDNLKSETADMLNAPSVPKGGAIHAALFLRKFVPEGASWAHIDIAGPGRASKSRPGTTVGASGFAVRTLLTFLADAAKKS